MNNMIRRGVVTKVGGDDKKYPETQIESLGATSNCEVLYGYGTHGNAPLGSIAAVLSNQGHEESQMGTIYHPDLRPKNLKEGEFVTGNFLKESYFFFKEDGSASLIIEGTEIATFENNKITLKVPTVLEDTLNVQGATTLDSTLDVEGATTLTSDVTSNGKDISDTHKHSGVQPGSGQSGPVV